jgi:hypothetical protein
LSNKFECRKYERISSKCHEEARESFGTEGDLLLINKHHQISCLVHAFEDARFVWYRVNSSSQPKRVSEENSETPLSILAFQVISLKSLI